MDHGFVVIEEFITPSDEREWGYPDYHDSYPIVICKSREDAQKFIDEREQISADKYMDFLDENKGYLESGLMTSIDYLDEERPDYYHINEVPYYINAS